MTLADAVARAYATTPGRPAVTFYDQATGERVELSWTTTANWVAKCANLLADELDVAPGDPVAIDLPLHWQSMVLLLAGWQVGGLVLVGSATAGAAVVRFAPAADPGTGDGQLVVLSLAPLGAPVRGDLPAGALDLGRVAPSQPDVVLLPVEVDPGADAVDDGSARLSGHDLMAAGEADRLLVADASLATPVVARLVRTLVAGGSLVLVRHAADLATIATTEHATATLGCDVEGLPRRS